MYMVDVRKLRRWSKK